MTAVRYQAHRCPWCGGESVGHLVIDHKHTPAAVIQRECLHGHVRYIEPIYDYSNEYDPATGSIKWFSTWPLASA